ncbi:MAG: hydroxyacid dehydrogenase [Alphaproteobacteria bacterium]|nr:hydroxyacid dehydrogenase [Alphaproteobacteria bacterium]
MKVVFHYDASPALLGQLRALERHGLAVDPCGESDDARFTALMREAVVLWHCLRPVSAADIAAAPKLRLIQKIGIGVNTIDLEAARARGVRVCNMPGTNSRAVAEQALMLMLAAARGLGVYDRATRAGRGWSLPPALQDAFGEIAGRTVGLVGYGAVPRLLAPILVAMEARVLYTDLAPITGALAAWRTLPDLLTESDIVSLHVPLTAATARLIDGAALARMKDGAILVNTARGGLIDQAALVAALRSGKLRAAGLDVFAAEPVPGDEPLLTLDNVVLSPHVAWLTPETLARSLVVAVENCRRLAAGEPLLHQVV